MSSSSSSSSSTLPLPQHQQHRHLQKGAESFLKTIQANPVEFKYCTALARRDGEGVKECFVTDSSEKTSSSSAPVTTTSGRYRSFLVYVQLAAQQQEAALVQRRRRDLSDEQEMLLKNMQQREDEIPVSLLPHYFTTLTQSIKSWSILFHSVAHSSSTTVLEYTLRFTWSGRLPGMTIGVYDREVTLKCIEILRWNEQHDAIVSVEVMMDRLEFLNQIGVIQSKL